jgi:hypothetical protein
MAQNTERIRASLDRYLATDFRGRLRAKGVARGMVWNEGVVPDGNRSFPDTLSADLLDFGYVVLALALELRDANLELAAEDRFKTDDAFELAAEAIESAVRRGEPTDGDQGRHLVVAAAAFHLAGFAARSFSLLPKAILEKNLASSEKALAFLLRRDLLPLRSLIIDWLGEEDHSDDAVAARLEDDEDAFAADDAVLLALSAMYFRALGLADTALFIGDPDRLEEAIEALRELIGGASSVGNIPSWWVATLTIHLLRDLWDQSLHNQLPEGPDDDLPERWNALRRNFIAQLAVRRPPHIDLWPSQLEAARRSVDPTDDLVIALPTSAGKTKIAELCILRALADEKRIIYVTPLRALSAQVERVLARTFVPLGAAVTSLYGAIGTSSVDQQTLVDADIVVATPEKLDFALRQDPLVLDTVGLIVLDEGHMIGLGSREIRYEALIQRLLRRPDAHERRIVCLSAMFNPEDEYFKDFGKWLRHDAEGETVHVQWRPTRRRLAHLDWLRSRTARLQFLDDEEAFVVRFLEEEPPATKRRKKSFPANDIEFCLAAANTFARDGHALLIYSPQRTQIDPLVREFVRLRKQGHLTHVKAPDPDHVAFAMAVGREWLGPEHPAVLALALGVGTHHGALPRPFQGAIEDLLERKRLPIVVASPTLAQGVDLSCSVLIFRSLTRFDAQTDRHKPISAAEFANVVGRAGRAYVDLDGIVVLPCFDLAKQSRQHNIFKQLIEDARKQELVSGFARLVAVLGKLIADRLGIPIAQLLGYVLNQQDLWSDERLSAAEEDEDDEDPAARTLDEYVSDLDVAILSLVEPLDTPVEELGAMLDDVLKESLWRRTLAHADEYTQSVEREVFVSRARWLWSHTTVQQRQACFSAGLGADAGTFLYDQLDELVDLLVALQSAIEQKKTAKILEISAELAQRIAVNPAFTVRKPPTNWRSAFTHWVRGTAFAEILDGLAAREEQRTQAFIQDGVVFRLVWAVEAVRVQAIASGHAHAEELGDGPMLIFTHGVPSIPAALLCQSGYASRTGAVWLTGKLAADFTEMDGLRTRVRESEAALSDDDFWDSDDHRLLWNRVSTTSQGDYPRRWVKRKATVSRHWHGDAPSEGSFVRLVPADEQTLVVCDDRLHVLGRFTVPYQTEGAIWDADVRADGSLNLRYFGPKPLAHSS